MRDVRARPACRPRTRPPSGGRGGSSRAPPPCARARRAAPAAWRATARAPRPAPTRPPAGARPAATRAAAVARPAARAGRPSAPRRRARARGGRARPGASTPRLGDLGALGDRRPRLAQVGEQVHDAVDRLRVALEVRLDQLALAEEVDQPEVLRDLAVAHVERPVELVDD